jgi:DNA-binding IclR family transcriptional regulator
MDTVSTEDVDRYRAPALDKGLDILELLAATEEGLSQAEIAKALDRTPNEIYRMLDRLTRRRFVARTSADRYELTLKLFTLVHQHAPIRRLVPLATPFLRDFARQAQ